MLYSGKQNQKWPTSGRIGYINTAAWGGPQRFKRGPNQKWPTSGPIDYITPAICGVPSSSNRQEK